jgi:hypothetical protein
VGAIASFVRETTGQDAINFEQFITFHRLVRDLPSIEKVLELYTATGGKIGRAKFVAALQNVCKADVTKEEIDLIFLMLDPGKTGGMQALPYCLCYFIIIMFILCVCVCVGV